MTKLKIITVPNSILRQKSKPARKIDKKIKKLAEEMINLIKNGQARLLLESERPRSQRPDGQGDERIGVGLSAVQIGKPVQLFVAYNPETKKDLVFVNPKIIWKSKEKTDGIPNKKFKYEGCLSIPGIFGLVKRHQAIKVCWLALNVKKHTKKFSGFLATVIQHEIDHLNGILFTDCVLKQKGKIYKLVKNKEGQEQLAEIKLL